MESKKGQVDESIEKYKVLMEVLVDHSRTEWGGMDVEGLLMLVDQETHPKANEDLYTLEEVAEIMSMSVLTIRQYVRMGKLRVIKVWRNWMVPSNEIARLIYEKKNGVALSQRQSMFVIMDASIEEEENFYSAIYKYKFLTINDVLNICGTKYNAHKIREYENLFEPSPIDSIWIDVVSNIPDFFRKTGDVPFQGKKNSNKKLNLNTDIQVSPAIIEKVLREPDKFLYSNDVEKDIQLLFGNPSDINTVHKMFKAILNLSIKIGRMQSEINLKNEYIKELEEKMNLNR